jgi:hypothetical protein
MIRIREVVCVLAMSLAAGLASAQAPQLEERKADHDALRALLVKSAQGRSTRATSTPWPAPCTRALR